MSLQNKIWSSSKNGKNSSWRFLHQWILHSGLKTLKSLSDWVRRTDCCLVRFKFLIISLRDCLGMSRTWSSRLSEKFESISSSSVPCCVAISKLVSRSWSLVENWIRDDTTASWSFQLIGRLAESIDGYLIKCFVWLLWPTMSVKQKKQSSTWDFWRCQAMGTANGMRFKTFLSHL